MERRTVLVRRRRRRRRRGATVLDPGGTQAQKVGQNGILNGEVKRGYFLVVQSGIQVVVVLICGGAAGGGQIGGDGRAGRTAGSGKEVIVLFFNFMFWRGQVSEQVQDFAHNYRSCC